ncbi:TonB-dependent receptor [Sphingomonas fennica]|nr:TonB-dependent receptor [Sphingomonas fennica]
MTEGTKAPRRLGMLLGGCAAMLLASAPAAAQVANADGGDGGQAARENAADEIIVTAQRREQAITETSASVTAFSAERLQSIDAQDARDLTMFAPSLTFIKSAQINQIAIRGLGSPGLDDFESAVGFYNDGVYTSKSRNALTPFYDMGGIEVLRGPQGVLFGKNALSGVVSLRTADPSHDFGGFVTAQGGSLDLFEATGAVTGGINDDVSFRLAGMVRRRGGYLDDLAPGKSDGGKQRTYAVRAKSTIDLGDTTRLKLKYEWFQDDEHGYTRQLTSVGPADAVNPAFNGIETELDDRVYSGQSGIYNVDALVGTRAHIATADLEQEIGNGDTLSIIAGYTNFHHVLRRGDALPIDTLLQANPTRNEAATLEIRLTSADDRPLRYIVGAYGDMTWTKRRGYSALNFTGVGQGVRAALIGNGIPAALLPSPQGFDEANTLILASPFDQKGKSWAAFAELSYDLTSKLSVTAGLRYSWDRNSIRRGFDRSLDLNGNIFASVASYAAVVPVPGFQIAPGLTVEQLLAGTMQGVYGAFLALPGTPADDGSMSDGNLQPAGRIEYRPWDRVLLYGTVQTGTKQGGFNASSLLPATAFGKEKALAFEIGAKYDFGIGYATLAAFRTNFDDLQVSATNTAGAVDTMNAAKAVSQGFEAEISVQPMRGMRLGASYAYLDAHYRRFVNAPCTVDQLHAQPNGCSQDLTGRPLPNAPANSASVYADTEIPLTDRLNLKASANIGWKSDFYTEITDTPQQKADSLAIVNGRIGVELPDTGLTVSLIAKNLFDERGALMRQRASNARDPGTILSLINEPRTFAVEARFAF